jgi:hypothetical protein
MEIEETPAERLGALKHQLSRIRFAQVEAVKAKDEDITHIESPTLLRTYPTDMDFVRKLNGREVTKYYRHFFGFTLRAHGGIHFDLKGRDRSPGTPEVVGLGIETEQRVGLPPKKGDWLAGILDPMPPRGPHFKRWTICTVQEKWFADYLLGIKLISRDNLLDMFTSSENGKYDHLVLMTKILVVDDLEWVLKARENPETRHSRDRQVQTICRAYNMEFWQRYEHAAREARKFSGVIPPPAPQPIVERRLGNMYVDPVGISTPFAGLNV